MAEPPDGSKSPEPDLDGIPTWRQLLNFFVPLGSNPLLVMGIHSVLDAGIARMPRPETGLAAFSVAKNANFFFNAPAFVLRQTAVALIDDEASYHRFRFVAGAMVAGLTACLIMIAYVEPLGRLLLERVLGLEPGPVMEHALLAMRVLCFMPVVEYLRNIPQAVAISVRRTILVPLATLLRVLFIAFLLFIGIQIGGLAGALTAAGVLILGMFFEAGLMVLGLRLSYPSVVAAAGDIPRSSSQPLTTGLFWRFFLPLAVMSLLEVFVPNVINAGLARSPGPEVALSAFAVSYGLIRTLAAPVTMLHQCPMVLVSGRNQAASQRVFAFCLLSGLTVSTVLGAIGGTRLLPWILRALMRIPSDVQPAAAACFRSFVPWPVITAWKEYHWGVFMRRRRTTMIAVGKLAKVAVTAAVVLIGVPMGLTGAPVVAAAAIITGEACETTIIWLTSRRRQQLENAAGAMAMEETGAAGSEPGEAD